MNLSLTLRSIAQRWPDRPAVSWEEGTLGYAALEGQVQRIAGALLKRHALRPGARVALAMENCPQFLPALYGIWRAGLAAVPLNSKLHPREMAWIMADSETKLCLASPKLAEGLSAPGVSPVPLPPILATGTDDYAGAADGRGLREPADRSASRGLAVLHQRYHRPAQRCRADPPQPALCLPLLLRRHRPDRPGGHDPACGAAHPRLRALRPCAHCAWLAQRDPVRLLRSRARARRLRALTPTSPCSRRRPWSRA